MPELPDITLYIEALQSRIVGHRLVNVRLASPFLVRSVNPPLSSVIGMRIEGLRRIGKQVVWELEGELYLVFHLMIAGRFHWRKRGSMAGGKTGLAAFDFEEATLLFTEASSKKRASLHVVRGKAALSKFDRGGVEVLQCTMEEFRDAVLRENHTLKLALTDPRLFSGIGNAYSDEILHRAKLSPLQLSRTMDDGMIRRLFAATKLVFAEWITRLREQTGDAFPEKVTAFHPEMAVHGKFGTPCPACATLVQRIVYAGNECNYCPRCQTSGRILADRSLSRLLKEDWPASIEEFERNPAFYPG